MIPRTKVPKPGGFYQMERRKVEFRVLLWLERVGVLVALVMFAQHAPAAAAVPLAFAYMMRLIRTWDS